MSPQLERLATRLAEVTGLDPDTARRALETNDPTMIRLAKSLVDLDETREEWHADMRRHRERLLETA